MSRKKKEKQADNGILDRMLGTYIPREINYINVNYVRETNSANKFYKHKLCWRGKLDARKPRKIILNNWRKSLTIVRYDNNVYK